MLVLKARPAQWGLPVRLVLWVLRVPLELAAQLDQRVRLAPPVRLVRRVL
jgi:hypothetical protein